MRLGLLRVGLAVLFLSVAAWVFIPALNRTSFYLTLLVTEFGLGLAPLGLFWLWRFRRRVLGRFSLVLALGASVILLMPFAATGWLYAQQDYVSLPPVCEQPPIEMTLDTPGLQHQMLVPACDVVGTVVLIHGGGWRSGKPAMLNHWRDWWVQQRFRVVMANHHKAPEHRHPVQQHDMLQIVDALSAAANEFGTEHVWFIQGHSSGGHLALQTAYTRPDFFDGVITFYAPTDLVAGYQPSRSEVIDTQHLLQQFMGMPMGDAESRQRYAEASPVYTLQAISNDAGRMVDTLILHGQRDDWVDVEQADLLGGALAQQQVNFQMHQLPFANHAFDFKLWTLHGWYAQQTVEDFVARRLPNH